MATGLHNQNLGMVGRERKKALSNFHQYRFLQNNQFECDVKSYFNYSNQTIKTILYIICIQCLGMWCQRGENSYTKSFWKYFPLELLEVLKGQKIFGSPVRTKA